MFRLLSLLILVGIGFFIGFSQSQNILLSIPQLQAVVVMPNSETSVVRCASDVKTAQWKLFRTKNLGFQLSYPPPFFVEEDVGSVTLNDGTNATIVLTKIRSDLKSQLDPSMQQGAWKIADRKLYALTTPYFTNDDGSLHSTYVFIRDFPQAGVDGRYAMVKAKITMNAGNPDFLKARTAGIVDVESILTVPEQILSTFRFLAFDET